VWDFNAMGNDGRGMTRNNAEERAFFVVVSPSQGDFAITEH
jgi:hypothetical protein